MTNRPTDMVVLWRRLSRDHANVLVRYQTSDEADVSHPLASSSSSSSSSTTDEPGGARPRDTTRWLRREAEASVVRVSLRSSVVLARSYASTTKGSSSKQQKSSRNEA